jgi:hypothetical protein
MKHRKQVGVRRPGSRTRRPGLARWAALGACLALMACAAEQPPPRVAMGNAARHMQDRIGATFQDCGEFDEPRRDQSCRLRRVEECMISALDACRPAHGAHVFWTEEGDPVRVDYFSYTDRGACRLMLVEDRSADPIGKTGVSEKVCAAHSWQPQPGRDSCELLSVSNCSPPER